MNRYLMFQFILAILTASFVANSQQTFLSQHSQIPELDNKTPVLGNMNTEYFVGCIDYNIRYTVEPTDDLERRENAEVVAATNKKALGDKRTICYNSNGDFLHIYKNATLVDRIWYFSDSNEEYTLFHTGILKFGVNDAPEREGSSELDLRGIVKTNSTRKILGYDTTKVTLRSPKKVTNYWVSENIKRIPASYENNKYGSVNKLYSFLKGVALLEESTVAELLTTTQEAFNIQAGEPSPELFKLPAVDVYNW